MPSNKYLMTIDSDFSESKREFLKYGARALETGLFVSLPIWLSGCLRREESKTETQTGTANNPQAEVKYTLPPATTTAPRETTKPIETPKDGKKISIDGSLEDWHRTVAKPIITNQKMAREMYVGIDGKDLYVGIRRESKDGRGYQQSFGITSIYDDGTFKTGVLLSKSVGVRDIILSVVHNGQGADRLVYTENGEFKERKRFLNEDFKGVLEEDALELVVKDDVTEFSIKGVYDYVKDVSVLLYAEGNVIIGPQEMVLLHKDPDYFGSAPLIYKRISPSDINIL